MSASSEYTLNGSSVTSSVEDSSLLSEASPDISESSICCALPAFMQPTRLAGRQRKRSSVAASSNSVGEIDGILLHDKTQL